MTSIGPLSGHTAWYFPVFILLCMLTLLFLIPPTTAATQIVDIESNDQFRQNFKNLLLTNELQGDEFAESCALMAIAIAMDLVPDENAGHANNTLLEINGSHDQLRPSSYMRTLRQNIHTFRWVQLDLSECYLEFVSNDRPVPISSGGFPAVDSYYRDQIAPVRYGLLHFSALTTDGTKAQYRFYMAHHPSRGFIFHNLHTQWGTTRNQSHDRFNRHNYPSLPAPQLRTQQNSSSQIHLPRQPSHWGTTFVVIGSSLIVLSLITKFLFIR